jgi:hypothetical protein
MVLATSSLKAQSSRVEIDSPNSSDIYVGWSDFRGWAIDDNSAIQQVDVSFDNGSLTRVSYGDSRGDVCAVYPDRAGCPNVGWRMDHFNVTTLGAGTHTLTATATTTDGRQTSVSRTFTVSTPGPHMNTDVPLPDRTYIGLVDFSGWAVDDYYPISSVNILIDDAFHGPATYHVSRGDVCATGPYPNGVGCPNVGWKMDQFNVTTLAAGPHKLTAVAWTEDGRQTTQLT